MNVQITTFTNPFSFFCISEDSRENHNLYQNETEVNQISCYSAEITEFDHGKYVAVMWKNKWARGIVSKEKQLLVWLIDYGIYLRPNDKNIILDLPADYKKLPSKVFEASIQGVVPVDKVWSWALEHCEITNDVTTTWTKGAIERAQELIKNSKKIYFKPIALLTTKHNDVVLGDLFLEIYGKGVVNIVDELQQWPVFMKRDEAAYVKNISQYYTSRKRHRACFLKPDIKDFNIPTITLETTFKEYSAILAESPGIETFFETASVFEDGSTVVGKQKKDKSEYKITPEDIEKYSQRHIIINGREYNVLTILINKARDFNICDRYKDHDLKSVGRATSYERKNNFS